MKKLIKNWLVNKYYTEEKNIINDIENSNCSFVSFDVFDTLIKRNLRHSQDVFLLLEEKYFEHFGKKMPVQEMRQKAEMEAVRNSRFEDVNISEIYEFFSGISEIEKKWLQEKEIEIEKLVCQKNYQMAVIYEWCINHGKHIIITSDMYLPEEVVIDILERAGYKGWKNLYISNDKRSRKSSGTLFDIVLKNEKILPRDLVHIGDALKGDYLKPREKGIHAILIRQNRQNSKYKNRKLLLRKENISYNIINSFIKNNMNLQYSFYQVIGYEVIGPILYGYCKWLSKKLEDNGIKKVYFLAREGFILKRAFDIFGGENLHSDVICVSRRATAIPLLYKASNLREILDRITVTRSNFTVGELLSSCDLSKKQINEVLECTSINCNQLVEELVENEQTKLFRSAKPYIDLVSQNQNRNIHGYLDQFRFDGKLAVCDVGWHGTIQNALQEIFMDSNIFGFYIGKKEKKRKNKASSEAFLFDDKTNYDIAKEVMSTVDLFELFFLSVDGSARNFEIDNEGMYYCVQSKPEQSKENAKQIIELQEAAYQFMRDFKKLDKFLDVDMRPIACAAAYSKFINPPTMEAVKQMSNFLFLNVGSHSLVPQHGLGYYLLRPRKLITEFLNNGCKALFLKKLFLIPFPYVNLIDFMRKFDRS